MALLKNMFEGDDHMNNLHGLFVKDLEDLYDAENQITKALPKMIKEAKNDKLRKGFEQHLIQTKEHIKRLKKIGDDLGIKYNGMKCKGMEGLLKEGEEVLKEKADANVKDAAIIGAAQKVEHYEIAGYGTAIAYAELMKHKNAVKLLKQTLKEEEATDKKLSQLAQSAINKRALN